MTKKYGIFWSYPRPASCSEKTQLLGPANPFLKAGAAMILLDQHSAGQGAVYNCPEELASLKTLLAGAILPYQPGTGTAIDFNLKQHGQNTPRSGGLPALI